MSSICSATSSARSSTVSTFLHKHRDTSTSWARASVQTCVRWLTGTGHVAAAAVHYPAYLSQATTFVRVSRDGNTSSTHHL